MTLTNWFRSVGLSTIVSIMGMALALLSSIALGRLLGVESLGQFSYVISIVTVLSIAASAGLPVVILRFTSLYFQDSHFSGITALIRTANQVITLLGVLAAFLMVLVAFTILEGSGPIFIIAAPLVVVIALVNARQRALQGFGKPVTALLPDHMIKHSTFLIGLFILIIVIEAQLSPERAMALWLFSVLMSFLTGSYVLWRARPEKYKSLTPDYGDRPKWIAAAQAVFLTEILGALMSNLDILLLGTLSSDREVGWYQIALRISGLMLIVLTASNHVLAPHFAKLKNPHEKKNIQPMLTRVTRWIFLAAAAGYFVAVIVGEFIITFLYGEAFSQAYFLLVLLESPQQKIGIY